MAQQMQLTAVERSLVDRIRRAGSEAIASMYGIAVDVVAYLRTAAPDRGKSFKLYCQSETGVSRSSLDKWCACARHVSQSVLDTYVTSTAYPPMAVGTLHAIAGRYDGKEGRWAADDVLTAMQAMAQQRGTRWTEAAAKAPLGALSDVEGLRKRAKALGTVDGLTEALGRLSGEYGPADVLVLWAIVQHAEDKAAAAAAKAQAEAAQGGAGGGEVAPSAPETVRDADMDRLSADLHTAEATVQAQAQALTVACQMLYTSGRIGSPDVTLFVQAVQSGSIGAKAPKRGKGREAIEAAARAA